MASNFFIRKRVHVEGILWMGNNLQKVRLFLGMSRPFTNVNDVLYVANSNGEKIVVHKGDYVVRDGKEIYAMHHDSFDETFKRM